GRRAPQRRAHHCRAGGAAPAARREPGPPYGAGPAEKSRGLLRQGERSTPVAVFRFIEAEKAFFPVAFLCRALGVSTSGYYAWPKRPRPGRAFADAALRTHIQQLHAASRGTYGAPRIHAELADADETRCGRKRVARLMRAAGLIGVCRRRVVRTTRRDETAPGSADLGHRAVPAPAPGPPLGPGHTHPPPWQRVPYLPAGLGVLTPPARRGAAA